MAGGALALLPGSEQQAAAELEQTITLYGGTRRPGEQHGTAGRAMAGADLAALRLRSGALDGAAEALEQILALPPAQRVATLTTRLARIRDDLDGPALRSWPAAQDLGVRLGEFTREPAAGTAPGGIDGRRDGRRARARPGARRPEPRRPEHPGRCGRGR